MSRLVPRAFRILAVGFCLLMASGVRAVVYTDGISREVVVQNSTAQINPATDAISREVVALRFSTLPVLTDAISREVVIVNAPAPPPPTDAVSRMIVAKNATATVDPDGDGVLTDDGSGLFQPCSRPNDFACDDNCPAAYNPDQRDGDGNGVGDVCDSPKVIRVVPGGNAVDVPVWAHITINFSEPMNPASIGDTNGDGTPDTVRLLIGGVPVAGSVSMTATGLAAVFVPAADLPVNTLVQVEATTGARDLQNAGLISMTSYFRTAATNDPAQRGLDGQEDQTGNRAGERFGTSVSRAGDVNGDGIDDWIVGAPGYDDPGVADRGRALLFLGSPYGGVRSQPSIIFLGTGAREFAGVSVAGGEDVNGDGRPDLLIGAEQHDGVGAFGPGRAYLIYFNPADYPNLGQSGGNPDVVDLSSVADVVFTGNAVGDRAGHSVALVKDFNTPADGRAEALIGAPRASRPGKTGCGETYIAFGASGLLGTRDLGLVGVPGAGGSDGLALVGEAAGDGLGWALSGGEDFNQDGLADILLGAPFHDVATHPDAGSAYLMTSLGGRLAVSRGVIEVDRVAQGLEVGVALRGDQSGQQLGRSVVLMGDIDGDGFPEAAIGAPNSAAGGGTRTGAGEVFLLTGHALSLTGGSQELMPSALRTQGNNLGAAYQGTHSGDALGAAVGSTPSRSSVGGSDLLMGAPGFMSASGASAGATYVDLAGTGASTISRGVIEVDRIGVSRPGEVYIGAHAGDEAGSAVATVGDVDGNGDRDFGIGAPKTDAPSAADAGALYLITRGVLGNGRIVCGPAGCVITDLGTGAKLTVPAQALTVERELGISALLSEALLPGLPPARSGLLGAVSLDPDATAFTTLDASLEIAMSESAYAGQVGPNEVFPLWRWNGTNWQNTGRTATIGANTSFPGRVSSFSSIDKLGVYAVFIGDVDADGLRDSLDPDIDGDGVLNAADNCPYDANLSQADSDHDGAGDACDPCPHEYPNDADGDGVCCPQDKCCAVFNPSQRDTNGNGIGDACEPGGSTTYVSSNPAETPDYGTIQTAVNGARAGMTIVIDPGSGPYMESVMVNRGFPVSLVGAVSGRPIVDGGPGAAAFTVASGAGSKFSHLTLRGLRGIDASVDTRIEDVDLRSITGTGLFLSAGAHRVRHLSGDSSVNAAINLGAGASLDLDGGQFTGLTGPGAIAVSGTANMVNLLVGGGAGDAVTVNGGGTLGLLHGTIAMNGSVGIRSTSGSVMIANSIVWGNAADDLVGIPCGNVSWSDVGTPNCSSTGSNLSSNPGLTGSYKLGAGSPCLERVLNPSAYAGIPCQDADGDLRLRDFDGDGVARLDLGAFERRNPIDRAEVNGLTWQDHSTLVWGAVPNAREYHVYRTSLGTLSYGFFGSCRDDLDANRTDTILTDSAVPPVNSGLAYLITAEDMDGIEGPLGQATCAERSNAAPCP